MMILSPNVILDEQRKLKNISNMIYFKPRHKMCGQQSGHKRQWRDYHTASGARPIKDFLLALPDEDRAAVLEEMEHVRQHGTTVARHVRQSIYEVRAIYDTK